MDNGKCIFFALQTTEINHPIAYCLILLNVLVACVVERAERSRPYRTLLISFT